MNEFKLSKGRIAVRYFLLVFVCGLIFWFSSNNGNSSTSQSGFVVDKLKSVFFPAFNSYSEDIQNVLTGILTTFVRKGAHFSIYALLGGVGYAAFFQVRNLILRYVCAVGFTFLYACTDEIHQTFVPDRAGQFTDVLIDTAGGMLGAFIVMIVVVICAVSKIMNRKSA